ncbi:glycosyltransferase [Ruegeria marina]|uniref:Glycosyl transferases group 1 n=1 Tax=Ruegeria marina TaxID=639004 RepID=A0A1G6VLL4_9RHOB|nr:glycosyltransferase [Ruegeria marina]SDD53746.1 Glycosyl transferases group 1 [Ruegeria marina]
MDQVSDLEFASDTSPSGKADSGKLKFDFVCLAVSNWSLVKSNPDYTFLGLAERGFRVLVVEPFESLPAAIRMAGIQKRRVKLDWGLRQVQENIWVYRPPPLALPGQSRSPMAARISGRLLAALVRRCIRKLNFGPVCTWSFMYNSGEFLRALPSDLRIYECGDDDAALARTDSQRRTVRTLDKEACEAADIVFAVTEELCAPRRAVNPATFEVNCGVDQEAFSVALDAHTEIPDSIAKLPKPILGYFGGLDPWKIDVPLITGIAKLRPEWSLVFIGYVWFGFDKKPFDDQPNIHVLGPKPYQDVPRFLKGMDIGLLPFPLNDITRNGDALKCYEYLAAGLPVVGRSVPVARRLNDLVEIAETPEEFVVACERHLRDTTKTKRDRSDAMRSHDWRLRVEQKISLIRKFAV